MFLLGKCSNQENACPDYGKVFENLVEIDFEEFQYHLSVKYMDRPYGALNW